MSERIIGFMCGVGASSLVCFIIWVLVSTPTGDDFRSLPAVLKVALYASFILPASGTLFFTVFGLLGGPVWDGKSEP